MPFLLYPVALIWSVQHDPFFWDTVQLASKHAHHFFEHRLQWLPLPAEIDSGHPPVFGYYLACIWSIFGKTLPASHWAMLPFLLLNLGLLYRIGFKLGGFTRAAWLVPIVMLDPVMAGQSVLISPDVVLVSGFLLAVDGILGKSRLQVVLGVLLLCMISMRGMMTAGALAVWLGLQGLGQAGFSGFRRGDLQAFLSRLLGFVISHHWAFLPGFLFAGWFLWWHKTATGWIGLHPASPWAPTFEPAQGIALLRNLLVLGWRWLDFGRVFEWILLFGLVWKFWPTLRKQWLDTARPESLGSILLLVLCLVVFLSPSSILFVNVSAHRYSLPGFIAFHFLVFKTLALVTPVAFVRMKRIFTIAIPSLLILSLALGNFWIYPRGVAMGWDSTLAHLPFHRLRAEALGYLDANGIDFKTVGSVFPNLNTGENMLLNGDPRHLADKDLLRNDYFFASNIFNDLSDNDFETLRNEWILEKKWQQSGVWVELYRRK